MSSLHGDRVVQAAVTYALMFQCDPMLFLDRPEEDLPVLLALIDLADKRLRQSQEAKHG